jgi:hypothetical protein
MASSRLNLRRAAKAGTAAAFCLAGVVAGAGLYFGNLALFLPGKGETPINIASSSRQLVSSNASGQPGNGSSGRPSFDDSGRYVAFTSDATNLAPGATNGEYNIYRKDRESGAVYLASPGLNGAPANGSSQFSVICSSGRFLAFASQATNLVSSAPRVSGKYFQVYVNDALTGQTTLVSANMDGIPANNDSRAPMFNHDCTKVVFESSASNLTSGKQNNLYNIYVKDLRSGAITLASATNSGGFPNNDSTHAAMDGGNLVAFTSWASDMPGAVSGQPAVYLRNLQSGRTVNVSSPFTGFCKGAQGFGWPNFSPDGRYLVFTSVISPEDLDLGGNCVVIWDILKQASAITGATGAPSGWKDACTPGLNGGSAVAPEISDATPSHPNLILFTAVARNDACSLVLRDLEGDNTSIKSQISPSQVLEPSINSSGDYLGWDVSGNQQQVYACKVESCTDGTS